MRSRIFHAIVLILLLLTIPASLVWVYAATPPQYDETYYGELAAMYERLKTAQGKKLIFVGGSSVAFGLNVSFMEAELEDYTVCPFGLYGTVGTKAMLELTRPCLKEGDVVVITPEIGELPLSLYFSAEELWKCADSNISIALIGGRGNLGSVFGSFPACVAERFAYFRDGKPVSEGVYAARSFNGNCQMIYPREHNIMAGLYDENDLVDFDPGLLDDDFLAYLNDYYAYAYSRGAAVCYNFCPVNKMAVTGTADIPGFYQTLLSELRFPVLGDPENYILDAEWFYDSNFHLNTAGSLVYTARLTDDVKSILGNTSPTPYEVPEKPIPPVSAAEGDNSSAQYFTYEVIEGGINLTGLTKEGQRQERLVLPASYDGVPVISFDETLFQGDVFLKELVIPVTICTIRNNSFWGCSNLERIVMEAKTPVCTVGAHLLDGCQSAMIYTADHDSYLKYTVNYYWSQYSARIAY